MARSPTTTPSAIINGAAPPAAKSTTKARRKKSPSVAPDLIETKPETGKEKFARIAQYRMYHTLHAIRLLGNLASPVYDWSPEQIAQINNTLIEAIQSQMSKFTNKSKSGPKLEETFKLLADANTHATS